MQSTMEPYYSSSSFGSPGYTPYTLLDIILDWNNQNQAAKPNNQSSQMPSRPHSQEVQQVPINTIPAMGINNGTTVVNCDGKRILTQLSSGMDQPQQLRSSRPQDWHKLNQVDHHSLNCDAKQGTCPVVYCNRMKIKLASDKGPALRQKFVKINRICSSAGHVQALHEQDARERTEVPAKRMKLDNASHCLHPMGPTTTHLPPLVESSCQANDGHNDNFLNSVQGSSNSRGRYNNARRLTLVRRKLYFYLLSSSCSLPPEECPMKIYCVRAKEILQRHFNTCNGENCPKSCSNYKKIIEHYSKCCDKSCVLCVPVRRALEKNFRRRLYPPMGNIMVDHPPPLVPQMDASGLVPSQLAEESFQIIKGDGKLESERANEPLEVKMCPSELPSEQGGRGEEVQAKIKMEGVTFTEHFTVEQMKQHIHSLREEIGKSNKMQNLKNENSCSLCGVETLMFKPPSKLCFFCSAPILNGVVHYTVPKETSSNQAHYICGRCYTSTRAEKFIFDGVPIVKTKLNRVKHTEGVGEPWVACCKCTSWQHQICSLFNDKKNEDGQAPYTCPTCYMREIENGDRAPLPESCVLGAKDLATCNLSDHLENRLVTRLRDEREERAKKSRVCIDEAPTAENLVVRVVSSVNKSMKVTERFRRILDKNHPSEFPYKSKAIVLFQKIEGVDVLLFSMFVQEYGAECPAPNQRHVYVSYLDSVKYFRPDIKAASGEALRTFVYHEILIGYLDYVKKRGFTSCYIWVSPPMKGDDYIIYSHPVTQKNPKSDKLREWYQAMLKKAGKERIVVGDTNLYDQNFSSATVSKAKITAARLPYFDGDYLPGAIEDTLSYIEDVTNDSKRCKNSKVKISRRALKVAKSVIHPSDSMIDIQLMDKIGQTIEKLKKNFILAHLHPICTLCSKYIISGKIWDCSHCSTYHLCNSCYEVHIKTPINERCSSRHTFFSVEVDDIPLETIDGDDTRQNEIFESRHTILDFCRDNNFHFDTLRHAKHSTMMCLYQMNNP